MSPTVKECLLLHLQSIPRRRRESCSQLFDVRLNSSLSRKRKVLSFRMTCGALLGGIIFGIELIRLEESILIDSQRWYRYIHENLHSWIDFNIEKILSHSVHYPPSHSYIFIYTRKRSGPSMIPCGMPLVTSFRERFLPIPRYNYCFFSVLQINSHKVKFFNPNIIPQLWSFLKSSRWSTQSKAL